MRILIPLIFLSLYSNVIKAQQDTIWIHFTGYLDKKEVIMLKYEKKTFEVIKKSNQWLDTFLLIDTNKIKTFSYLPIQMLQLQRKVFEPVNHLFYYDPKRKHIHIISGINKKQRTYQSFYLPDANRRELYIRCGNQ